MICAIDTETYIKKNGKYYPKLDCTKFTIGCLITERNKKPLIFTKKEDMWNKILYLGEKEAKRNKTLTVYAHNMAYDFYAIANLKQEGLKFYSNRPFITVITKNGKEIVKFLDLHAILKAPLSTIGQKLGIPKLEMPKRITKKEQLTTYVTRDTEIVLKAIKWLKEYLKESGTPIRRLYTINQIAISYLLKLVKEMNTKEDLQKFFWNASQNETRRTFRAKEIHGAYRGGKVEAYKTGIIEGVNGIDFNSQYSEALKEMQTPNLATERKHYKPTKEQFQKHIKKIGLSRCVITNETCKLRLLPIRTTTNIYFPKEGKTFIGTYTHQELRLALNEGYEIHNTEWSITYEQTKNIFTEPIKKIYKLRKESKCEIENMLLKGILNGCIGKLGQTKTGQEFVIDTIEQAQEYIKKNYMMVKGIEGTDQILYKTDTNTNLKPYYTPIIPTLVNATARCMIYKEMKKIPLKDLVYTDTDSIYFQGNHFNKFRISKEIGEFKIINKNEQCIIYGKKTYKIGTTLKVAGIKKYEKQTGDFKKGIMKSEKMNTIYTTNNPKMLGKFQEEIRDLKKQLKEHHAHQEIMESQQFYIDADIEDINYFLLSKSLNTTNAF